MNKPKVYLVNFGTEEFDARQKRLNESALSIGGIDAVVPWNWDKLKTTEFYRKHKDILDHQTGAGFWQWKPYIIFEQLKEVNEGDFVVYWDVGSKKGSVFQTSIQPLIDWCVKNNNGSLPGFYMPWHGPNKKWTKRDCFLLMDCDNEKYWNHCQIGATYSIWQKNAFSLNFVSQWLKYAEDERIITDAPNVFGKENYSDFREHRRDQSILTNLVVREGLKCYTNPYALDRDIAKDINDLIRFVRTPQWRLGLRFYAIHFLRLDWPAPPPRLN